MGLFADLTAPMKKEAASAGVLDTPFGNFARLQIRTIEDPFAGKNLPVYGIDEKDIEDWDRRAEQKAIRDVIALRSALRSGAPLASSWFATGSGGGADVDWEHINSEEYGKSRYQKSPDDADFAVPRDRGIARNCVEVMKKHRGKRLAVVIGAHHKPFLEILLKKRGDVRVLTLGRDVPFPTEEQVARSWTTQDLLATLGHNLDSGVRAVYRPRLKKLLTLLEKSGEAADAARYFRARILTIEGKPEAAEKLLGGLRASSAVLYPFPMRNWRMRYSLSEAARIEKARLLIARGEEEAARPLLESVGAALDARLGKLTRSHTPVHRTVLALKDPGFEAGKRAGLTGLSAIPRGAGKVLPSPLAYRLPHRSSGILLALIPMLAHQLLDVLDFEGVLRGIRLDDAVISHTRLLASCPAASRPRSPVCRQSWSSDAPSARSMPACRCPQNRQIRHLERPRTPR